MHAFSDPSWKVRMHAAELMAHLLAGQKHAPRPFLRLLRDRNELVRVQALEGLIEIGDRKVLKAVHSTLTDRSPLVRGYGAATVGALGGRADKNLLLRRLQTEQSDTARLGLLAALYSLGDDAAYPRILQLLQSDDFEVRGGTASTLVRSIATRSNARAIEQALAKALRVEQSANARAHFRELIKELRSRFAEATR
jgi:HEAT repeat protein